MPATGARPVVPPGGVRPSPEAADSRLGEAEGPFLRPGATAPGVATDYDVVVVGAGPAGSETARRLADAGRHVLVLEEHLEVGEPVQCAGLIAHNTFALIGLDPHGDFHQQEIRGGHIVAPNGRRIVVTAPEVHAHAVSRAAFDRTLAARAVAAGAELVRGATFVDSTCHGAGSDIHRRLTIRVRADRDAEPVQATVTCRMLVGADGVGSEVARTAGFVGPAHVLSGLEIELEGLDIPDPENVRVHTGSHIAPGYFAWVVPNGPTGARVGLCIDIKRSRGRSALDYYHEYVKLPDMAGLVKGGHEVQRIVGCIPLGLRKRLVADGVALVGDAGGFAKPTSGGGIYMASWGAKHLAAQVDDALKGGDTRLAALKAYERKVHRTIGRELTVGAALHRVFRKMKDAEMDTLLDKLDDPKVIRSINRHGDIDHPSRLVVPMLLRRPSLIKYAGPAAKELLRGVFRPGSLQGTVPEPDA